MPQFQITVAALLLPLLLWANPKESPEPRKPSSEELITCGDVVLTGRVVRKDQELYLKLNENSASQMQIRLSEPYAKPLRYKLNQIAVVRGFLSLKESELHLSFDYYKLDPMLILSFINKQNVSDLLNPAPAIKAIKPVSCQESQF